MKHIHFLILILFFPIRVIAGTQNHPLLNEPFRPTVEQYEDTRAAHPNLLPTASTSLTQETLINIVARTMAWIEYAYPGATFAPLGRDAVILGDALDAAYRMIGQKNRVKRVDLSGSSFFGSIGERGYEIPDVVMDYLNSIGLDPERLVKEKKPVLFGDRTSYNPWSQSTKLLKSLYMTYIKKGGDPKELFKVLNFVALDPEANPYPKDVKDYLTNPPLEYPEKILTIPGITDSSPWHKSWQTPTVTPNGVIPVAGELENDEVRGQVLSDLEVIHQAVRSPRFWVKVALEFKRLKIKVPFQKHLNEIFKNFDREELLEIRKESGNQNTASTLKEVALLFQSFEDNLELAVNHLSAAHGNIHWSDPLCTFLAQYGYRLEQDLREISSSHPELLQKYTQEMHPKLFKTLVTAAIERTKARHAHQWLLSFVLYFTSPIQVESTSMKRVLLDFSRDDLIAGEIENRFKEASGYTGPMYQIHPRLKAEERIRHLTKTVETLQKLRATRAKRTQAAH